MSDTDTSEDLLWQIPVLQFLSSAAFVMTIFSSLASVTGLGRFRSAFMFLGLVISLALYLEYHSQ